MARERLRSALVWRTGALGDFVLSLPVLDAVRERADYLVLIAPTRYQALFAGADRWLDSDGAAARDLFAGTLALDVDLGIAWTGTAAEALARAGVSEVLCGVARPPAGRHQVDSLWEPLVPWLGPRDRLPRIHPPGTTSTGASVVVAPGSGGASKRWPIERWRAATDGLECLWITGPDEACDPSWTTVRQASPDLPGLIGLARSCAAWLGPDSGPQHLAAACGAAVGVVFTGATDPASWAPPGAQVFGPGATPADVRAWLLRATDGPTLGDPSPPPRG